MDQTIKIRVSAEDKANFEKAATAKGLSLSSWIRMTLKGVAGTGPLYRVAVPITESLLLDKSVRYGVEKIPPDAEKMIDHDVLEFVLKMPPQGFKRTLE